MNVEKLMLRGNLVKWELKQVKQKETKKRNMP